MAFESAEAYEFRTERKERSAEEVECRSFAIERKAPPDHWPLLAGEAIHNLRGALDHFVHEVSGGYRDSQFPIFTDRCEFQVLGTRKLKRVPKTVRARIEEAQPYRRMPQNPPQDALARLRVLSNLDKHRVLATVVASVYDEWIGGPDGVEIDWTEPGLNKALGAGETYISTLIAKGEITDVDVKPEFGYQVRIEGHPVAQLDWIAREVSGVLAMCEGKVFDPAAAA